MDDSISTNPEGKKKMSESAERCPVANESNYKSIQQLAREAAQLFYEKYPEPECSEIAKFVDEFKKECKSIQSFEDYQARRRRATLSQITPTLDVDKIWPPERYG